MPMRHSRRLSAAGYAPAALPLTPRARVRRIWPPGVARDRGEFGTLNGAAKFVNVGRSPGCSFLRVFRASRGLL